MGFVLWVKDNVARAEGTHEYRPMGVAIVAETDLFRARDFRPRRSPLPADEDGFAGYFASIGHLNDFLRFRRNRPNSP